MTKKINIDVSEDLQLQTDSISTETGKDNTDFTKKLQSKYDKKLQPRQIIKCPSCGWEYLPGEILFPDQVLGQPNYNVVRDPLGHILYEDYQDLKEPLAEDSYTCDNCLKPFIISIETKYKVKKQEEELDFSNLAVSLF